MTDDTDTNGGKYRSRLGEISHTHPDTNEAFGDAMAYHRGPTVAADGGANQPERSDDRLRDVDHEPPAGEGAQGAYDRGTEGRSESV
jgi:hypothetical protein